MPPHHCFAITQECYFEFEHVSRMRLKTSIPINPQYLNMDLSTKGLTTVITAAGLNCKPTQNPHPLHNSTLRVFQSMLELSYRVFLRINGFQCKILPQQTAVEFTVISIFSDTKIHFHCQTWGCFPMKRHANEGRR